MGADELCSNINESKCAKLGNATNEQVHEIGLTWRLQNPDDRLFENFMDVPENELIFTPVEYSEQDLWKARNICNNVRQERLGMFCVQNPACIFDFLSTKDEEYALNALKDFGKYDNEKYIGDLL